MSYRLTHSSCMSASDDRIFSRDSYANKGEEATHSSHKVTSRSSSILEDMQDSPGYDSTTEDKIAVILPNGKKLLVVCQKPVLLKKLKESVCTKPDISHTYIHSMSLYAAHIILC